MKLRRIIPSRADVMRELNKFTDEFDDMHYSAAVDFQPREMMVYTYPEMQRILADALLVLNHPDAEIVGLQKELDACRAMNSMMLVLLQQGVKLEKVPDWDKLMSEMKDSEEASDDE